MECWTTRGRDETKSVDCAKASRSALKFERLSRLWFDIMNRLGPWYRMLAAAPDDPSLN